MGNFQASHTTVTELALGDYAGLIIEEVYLVDLHCIKVVKVTHKAIEGFEARAMIASTMTTIEIFEAIKKDLRLAA